MGLSEKELYIKRNKERPWYKHLKAARQRCNDKNASNYKWYGAKGIKCLLTIKDIKYLWNRDKAWLFKEAHLSRNIHDEGYYLDNCYFSNKKKNVGESNKRTKSKSILQFKKNGTFIKEWESSSEVKRVLGIENTGNCANNKPKYKIVGGFIWRFKQ
jgi:hypothetical protein